MADERSLPGWPTKKLVKDVRKHLLHYGIRPVRDHLWRAAWTWAEAIARSYWRTHWPLPSEIATQYILLLLSDMKRSIGLRLPHRARQIIPGQVAVLLPNLQSSGILAIASRPSQQRPGD